jgi:hypothetical protein
MQSLEFCIDKNPNRSFLEFIQQLLFLNFKYLKIISLQNYQMREIKKKK